MTTRLLCVAFSGVTLLFGLTPTAQGGWWSKGRQPACCPTPVITHTTPSAPLATEPAEPTAPSAPAPEAALPMDTAFDDAFAAGAALETAGNPTSLAPYMLGDAFGISGNFFLGYISAANGGTQVSANSGSPIAGGRRIKISESVSPMPRDRIFFTYNGFRDAYQTQGLAGGVRPRGNPNAMGLGGARGAGFGPGGPGLGSRSFDVNRFTFGLEKTFFGGNVSAEVRVPFSSTLGSNIFVSNNNIPGEENMEFENISTTLKALLYRTPRFAVSGGMVINVPTADDVVINQQLPDVLDLMGGGTRVLGHNLVIQNDSVHISPFLGYLMTPTNRWFIQGFAQVDLPLNGNDTIFTPVVDGTALPAMVSSLDDQALLQLDIAAGYWIYLNPTADWLRGIASILELHYTTTLEDADLQTFSITAANTSYNAIFGNSANRVDIMNLTLGTAMRIRDRSTVSAGFVLPLNKSQTDQNFLFDWEFQLQFNYQFGGTSTAIARSPLF